MFIKFLQSSLFSSPSPLSIVLASPLLNLSFELIPDVPLSFCVGSTVQDQGLYIIFDLRAALSSTRLQPKRRPRTAVDEIERDGSAVRYAEAAVNFERKPFPNGQDRGGLFFGRLPGFNLTRRSSNARAASSGGGGGDKV